MPQIIKSKRLSPKKKSSKVKKKTLSQRSKTPLRKKTSLAVVPSLKSPRNKTSTLDYYNCLLNYSQQGFYDEQEGKRLKIHACCKKCKLAAPSLNSQRDKELVKLISSYKQFGDSLKKLLKPLN